MSQRELAPIDASRHTVWQVHLFIAGLIGAVAVLLLMTGALAWMGAILFGVAIVYAAITWTISVVQRRHEATHGPLP